MRRALIFRDANRIRGEVSARIGLALRRESPVELHPEWNRVPVNPTIFPPGRRVNSTADRLFRVPRRRTVFVDEPELLRLRGMEATGRHPGRRAPFFPDTDRIRGEFPARTGVALRLSSRVEIRPEGTRDPVHPVHIHAPGRRVGSTPDRLFRVPRRRPVIVDGPRSLRLRGVDGTGRHRVGALLSSLTRSGYAAKFPRGPDWLSAGRLRWRFAPMGIGLPFTPSLSRHHVKQGRFPRAEHVGEVLLHVVVNAESLRV